VTKGSSTVVFLAAFLTWVTAASLNCSTLSNPRSHSVRFSILPYWIDSVLNSAFEGSGQGAAPDREKTPQGSNPHEPPDSAG
jgi:hypothetical protein